MAKCSFCNKTIVFGGRRVGELLFCNAECLIHGRQLVTIDENADAAGLREAVRDLRDALLVVAEETEQQRTLLTELTERLDFAERALAQLGASATPIKQP
jgi:hypothetical protein